MTAKRAWEKAPAPKALMVCPAGGNLGLHSFSGLDVVALIELGGEWALPNSMKERVRTVMAEEASGRLLLRVVGFLSRTRAEDDLKESKGFSL